MPTSTLVKGARGAGNTAVGPAWAALTGPAGGGAVPAIGPQAARHSAGRPWMRQAYRRRWIWRMAWLSSAEVAIG